MNIYELFGLVLTVGIVVIMLMAARALREPRLPDRPSTPTSDRPGAKRRTPATRPEERHEPVN